MAAKRKSRFKVRVFASDLATAYWLGFFTPIAIAFLLWAVSRHA